MSPRPTQVLTVVVAVSLVLASLSGCRQPATDEEPDLTADTTATSVSTVSGVVEVAAVDYAFRAPAEIRSGWTTFRMRNEGEEHHLMVLWSLPEGRNLQDYLEGVVQPFAVAFDSLTAEAVDVGGMWILMSELQPEWAGEVRAMGGPGLIAPGEVAETTVKLEPGPYVMECYVKNPEGKWHTELGMIAEINVTEETTGASPPVADIEITLTNAGIETSAQAVAAGKHTVAVHYREHPEHGLGNDVHVARLDENTSAAEAVEWTHWWLPEGLRAPAPVRFLGGAQEMPVGYTSYFTVELEPGRHVWLSEATDVDGLVEEFTVE